MPYADGSFDLVLSVEAISHYRDVGAFIGEAARVLRTGGTLLLSDGNNGRNPRIRRATHALWEEFETGKPSKLGRKHERDGSIPAAARRDHQGRVPPAERRRGGGPRTAYSIHEPGRNHRGRSRL